MSDSNPPTISQPPSQEELAVLFQSLNCVRGSRDNFTTRLKQFPALYLLLLEIYQMLKIVQALKLTLKMLKFRNQYKLQRRDKRNEQYCGRVSNLA
jgi:hypothetical protein